MSAMALSVLLAGVATLLLAVGWIAWRYFLVAPPVRPPAREQDVLPPPPPRQAPAFRLDWLIWLRHRYLWLGILCAVLGGLAALALGRHAGPGALMALSFERGEHIQRTLAPEQLVPPPPLPPSVFVGTERPELESADRDWSKLDPLFAQRVLQLLARVEARGYTFTLLEGYRSPERQDRLANLGSQVTAARAMQSRHQFGLAADLAPLRDGRLVISERDGWAWAAYQALGQEAEALGLTWGGRWALRDYGHVELNARPRG